MTDFNPEDFCSEENISQTISNAPDRPSVSQKTPVQDINIYSHTQWSEVFKDSFRACGNTREKLPAGLYKVQWNDNYGGLYFVKQEICIDEYINIRDSLSNSILKEIEEFWGLKDVYHKHGFLHRRGYLLYGPQGSGKTIIIQQIIDGIIAKDGIAVIIDRPTSMVFNALTVLREVERNRSVVVVFEDIDAMIKECGEIDILSYLDGENRIESVLNVATTNYPERLDKRIVSRPRRFDRVIKVKMPNDLVRREYFKKKLNLVGEELEKWVISTSNFSFAALADLIISVKCFNYKFEEAIERLRLLQDSKPSSEEFREQKLGFIDGKR